MAVAAAGPAAGPVVAPAPAPIGRLASFNRKFVQFKASHWDTKTKWERVAIVVIIVAVVLSLAIPPVAAGHAFILAGLGIKKAGVAVGVALGKFFSSTLPAFFKSEAGIKLLVALGLTGALAALLKARPQAAPVAPAAAAAAVAPAADVVAADAGAPVAPVAVAPAAAVVAADAGAPVAPAAGAPAADAVPQREQGNLIQWMRNMIPRFTW